jgi:Ca2+-binding RTX toxin-like protein
MAIINGTTGNDVLTGTASDDTINGLGGNDTLSGGDGNDILVGGAGADAMDGGNGTDTASYAGSTAVTIDLKTGVNTGDALGDTYTNIEKFLGSSGADTFISGVGADDLNGGGGVDTVSYATSSAAVTVDLTAGTGVGGDAAGDVLTSIEKVVGSAFADTLSSSTSANVLQGGTGNDVYFVGNSGVTVTESAGEGTDEVRTALASLALAVNVENLTYTGAATFSGTGNASDNLLTGGSGADTLSGAAGSDTLIGGDGNDILIGGAGADNLSGGIGIDTASYAGSAALTINLKTGVNTGDAVGDTYAGIEKYLGTSNADTFVSGTTADDLNGGAGVDTIDYSSSTGAVTVDLSAGTGSGGDAAGDILTAFEKVIGSASSDTLTSATASTTLQGGAGNDLYFVGASSVTVTEIASEGTDEVRTSLASLTLAANVENLSYTGVATFAGTGNALDNVITGGTGADTLSGAAGVDTLNGGDGNDVLIGGAGADVLNGGLGLDSASYAGSAALTIDLKTGASTGDATGDVYNSIEKFVGTANADTFISGAAADTLDGGAGTDTINYATSAAAVTVDLTAGTGVGGDAGGDVLTAFEKVVGSAFSDILTSSTTSTTLQGGAGDDTYIVGSTGVTITESASEGTDEVRTALATLSIASSANVENLTYTGSTAFTGTGNAIDNVISGGIGADSLTGGAGNDTLNGGDGNDTLIGGAGADMLNGGIGTDIASYAGSAALTLDLKTGASTGDATGDVYNSIEKYVGTANADTFISGAAADTLDGGAGTDTINYGTSAAAVTVNLTAGTGVGGDAAGDVLTAFEKVVGSAFGDILTSSTTSTTLQGGAGDDTYIVGSTGVTITESASEGTDEVRTALATLSIASSANVENLTYTGSAAFTGTGNAVDNVISGGLGADSLTGGAGNDTLNGGDGNDTLIGGVGADMLNGGIGTDIASYAGSAALTVDLKSGASTGDAAGDTYSGIEKFVGTANADTFVSGAGADSLDGGAGVDTISYSTSAVGVTVDLTAGTGVSGDANGDVLIGFEKIIGSAFADTLSSSTNSTTLSGGVGDDVYVIGSASAAVVENASEGTDEVRTTLATSTLGNNLENLTYTGAANFSGTGNGLDNVIAGGVGADTLSGKAGIDTLLGGDGNDILIGGAGADGINGGSGNDIASYIDSSAAITFDIAANASTGDAMGDSYSGVEGIRGTEFGDTYYAGSESLAFDGGAGTDTVSYASSGAGIGLDLAAGTGSGDAAGDSYTSVEAFVFTAYADTITGSSANEIFTGGVGADTIDGGGGSDIISYRDSGSAVTVDLSSNTVSGGTASGDIISNIEGVYGSDFNDTLTGNALDNVISGGVGDDVMSGGSGNDTITGEISLSSTSIDEAHGGDGNDNIDFSKSGTGFVYGDAGDDTLKSGRSGVSLTYGGDGNDTITVFAGKGYGEDGSDTLTSYDNGTEIYGGAGNDVLKVNFNGSMFGGEGSDEYSLDQMSTSIAYIKDDGLIGTDTVFTNWEYAERNSIIQQRVGDDLRLSLNGETLVLQEWYNGYNTIENFVSSDHQFILLGI